MKKLFRKAIAVVLCFTLLNNVDFSAFFDMKDVKAAEGLVTVSENNSVSQSDSMSAGDAGDGISVIVNHYLGEVAEENMVFAPKAYTGVESGDTILNVIRENNGFVAESVTLYKAEDGVKSGEGAAIMGELQNNGLKIDLTGDEYLIDVVYQETTGTLENEITIFDYTNGDASNQYSINYFGNYPSDVPYNQRIGTLGAKKDYVTLWEQSDGKTESRLFNINEYTRYDYNYEYVLKDEDATNNELWKDYRKDYPIIEGLVLGLDGENYSNVKFRFADPGFFSNDGKKGKKIEEGYEFVFNRTGMMYELISVVNDAKNVELTDLSAFFPLSAGTSKKNDYFGIRYDFTFELGDYVGEMVYSFAGDDDVWVCLDGEVIMDLGGIHGVYPSTSAEYNKTATYAPNSVDVWKKILGKEEYSLQDRIDFVSKAENASREYTVTVLYMERGGWKSNCYIDFVIPNVVAAPPVVSTTANFPIAKVDANSKESISGVEFTLTTADNAVVGTGTTDEKGNLTFFGLEAGTYYLTETKAQDGYDTAGPWAVTVSQSQSANTIIPYVSKATLVSDVTVELVKENGYYVIENKSLVADLELTKMDSVTKSGLAGATFLLVNKEGTRDFSEAVISSADGSVKFEDIPVGEYTLTETIVPEGYIAFANSWDVVVDKKQDSVEATIVDVEKSEGDKYIIENTPVENVVDYDKTATLLNDADRTYTINIGAETKKLTVQGENASVDIVLTIDNSRSMLFPAELTAYKGNLDRDNVYYYYSGTNATVMIAWYSDGWHTMDSSEWKYHGSDSKSYNVRNNDMDQNYTISSNTQYYTSEEYTSQLTASTTDVVSGVDPKHGYSNKYDRMQVLKKAVAEFLDELRQDSPNSQVAVVTFGGTSAVNKTGGLTDIDSAKVALNAVQISADGGTPTQNGLEEASKVLNTRDDKNDFVVLISDGLQTIGNATIPANAIKAKGTKLISLGLNISNVAAAEEFLKGLSSDGTVYLANNAEALIAALGVISGEITQGIALENVQIIDYVDPRFEITEESKAMLEASGATVSKADGMDVVIWSGVTLTTTPWNGEIIVKAKNDFLGGDEVPTNGPESAIVINGTVLKLPIPIVDVRLLMLDIVGGETTIFLGEEVTPMAYWQEEVEGSLKAVYVNSKQQSFELGLSVLSEEKCAELFEEGSCTVPYLYGDIQFGNLVYKVTGAPLGVHEAEAVGSPYETYEFTVSYEAFDRTNNTDELFGSVSADCKYDVNVVAGTLTIRKTIKASDYAAVQGDPIFTFRVMKDGEFFAYRTIRFTEMKVSEFVQADGNITLEAENFEDLEKGVYTVEELKALRFACTEVEASGNAKVSSDVAKRTAVFEIGYDAEGEATRLEGLAEYTNKKEKENNFSDTDVVINTCSFDSEGNLVWSGDKLTGAQE